MRMHQLLAIAAVILFPVSADAAVQVLTVTGHIKYIGAVQLGQPTSTPSGLIALGDTYTLTMRFDPAVAQLNQDGPDPTINSYELPGATMLLKVGSYSTALSGGVNPRPWAQLFNDTASGMRVADGQVFGFDNAYVGSPRTFPFPIGEGPIFEGVTAQAFDYTATARSNNSIADIQSFDKFGYRGFSYALRNYDTRYFVDVYGDVSDISLSGVPEPATWALMTMGFGAIGFTMRQRRTGLGFI